MEVFESIDALRRALDADSGARVALVPTMGALHRGHLSLLSRAAQAADRTVASIFVNPTQFAPGEDLARYPRPREADLEALARAGCDFVFTPTPGQMYPEGFETKVEVGALAQALCGASRPRHFAGVATVVLKLLNIVRPRVAVFGEKDYQQLVVIRRMVKDLDVPVEILGAPLVREPDGLALSSRNIYLSPAERKRALSLSRGLLAALAAYRSGERQAEPLLACVRGALKAEALCPEYLELRHAADLTTLREAGPPALIMAAVIVGSTRLIDNTILRRP